MIFIGDIVILSDNIIADVYKGISYFYVIKSLCSLQRRETQRVKIKAR